MLALPAAPASAAAGCTIVFGQGRNRAAAGDPANRFWDDVNIDFNAEVAGRLKAGGVDVIALALRVAATDLRANVRRLLERADAEGCTTLVETTIFADAAAGQLVARLRSYPILVDPGRAAAAPILRIGAPSFVDERSFEWTRTTLDRVKPAVLARSLAGELLARRAAAAASAAASALSAKP
ncbi:MAG: hypothetical protein KGL43_16045 [Burkholderiales bacterium]|nr:hypothetical protein [Burkholderiales bacterium]MDE2455104.1 hypothetical protein [Burkholderiales bacterium]